MNLVKETGLSEMILWAIPVFFILILLEFILSQYHNRKAYEGKDFFASIGIGLGNLVVSALTKAAMFSLVLFVYNLVPWAIPVNLYTTILCLVWLDFWRYWSHRLTHENRFWWATHVVHHNSEEYNFSVSFRLSWIQGIKVIFFLPVVLAGFNPVIFFICHQVEVLYQFWIHTKFINKLPAPIEYVFVTPSHHRVHHACNEKYLDKNYGSTFILWDRIFGTFQPEEEMPKYGITKPVKSFNPVTLVFHELVDIVKDIGRSRNFREAWLRTFIRPSRKDDLEMRLKLEYEQKQVAKAEAQEVAK